MGIRTMAVMGSLTLALVACSDDGGTTDDGGDPGSPTEAAEATVEVEDSELGEIVVDAEGTTLYVFLADEGTESTCYEGCVENWPPLTVEGEPVAGEGIDASLGTSERTDGSAQVTLDGHPLYYFAGDETADDLNGQGVGEVWYVVSPTGEAIR